jgi:glycolate oxidase FAD binding subunit
VLSEVTIRVVPAPESERTLLLPTADATEAVRSMSRALGSPFDVSSAAFDPERGCLLRLEGFASSVASRVAGLRKLLGAPVAAELDAEASRASWREIGSATALADWPVVWRISVPPSEAPRTLAALCPERYLLDWGGGLIWAAYRTLDAARVRGALSSGHATLLKAPRPAASDVPVFHPQPPAVAAIAARLKHAFDPAGKLNPGRMG